MASRLQSAIGAPEGNVSLGSNCKKLNNLVMSEKPHILYMRIGVTGDQIYLSLLSSITQAAALHLHRYLTDGHGSAARLWRSVIGTSLFAILMLAFA